MSAPIETREVGGLTIEIYPDEDCPSPREAQHGCELALSHKRYNLPNDAGINPDDFDGIDAIIAHLSTDHDAVVTQVVRGYDHGTLIMSVSTEPPFSDPWDSGILGLAYVTRKGWADTQGTGWAGTAEQIAQAYRMIAGDVDEYSKWAAGECYGYKILNAAGHEVASGDGRVGYEYAIEEATGQAGVLKAFQPGEDGLLASSGRHYDGGIRLESSEFYRDEFALHLDSSGNGSQKIYLDAADLSALREAIGPAEGESR